MLSPAVLIAFLWGSVYGQKRNTSTEKGLLIDTVGHFIELPALYHPSRFNRVPGLKNHHFITWEKGSAARKALFTTSIPDSSIHDALERIGAVPGNNLKNETWTQRNDKNSPYPDLLVEGSPVAIGFIKNGTTIHVEDILKDENGKPFDFRFGGNRALIPIWRSGCVVCLQSCPGSKIGNRSYSIRDLINETSHFSLKQTTLLHEGDSLHIRITIRPASK